MLQSRMLKRLKSVDSPKISIRKKRTGLTWVMDVIALGMGKGVVGEGVVAYMVKNGREEFLVPDRTLESIMPGTI